jgi:hypothetical protein
MSALSLRRRDVLRGLAASGALLAARPCPAWAVPAAR